jgi:hypothetical protein
MNGWVGGMSWMSWMSGMGRDGMSDGQTANSNSNSTQ